MGADDCLSELLPRVEHDDVGVGEITDVACHEFAVACMCSRRNDRIEGGHGFALCLGMCSHLCPGLRRLLVKRQDSIFKAGLAILAVWVWVLMQWRNSIAY